MADKKRLDLVVVERGLINSRSQARAAIMAGQVIVDGCIVDKAGILVSSAAVIALRQANPFVSRGGLKLQKALDAFGIELSGRTVLDVGASTGGFTDCALKAGAGLVYAVDVGYGQLAWSLRTDPRVINLERTNIRYLSLKRLERGQPDFCCIDVAFISLRLVLPSVVSLLTNPGEILMLIKPQFEAGREQVGKRGVVKDSSIHIDVIDRVLTRARELGIKVQNLSFSPVQGPQGNIEYLAHGALSAEFTDAGCPRPEAVVTAAHAHF